MQFATISALKDSRILACVMIFEGLMTSKNENGVINVAPMGPIVRGDFESLLLRPFEGSTTFQNLLTTRRGVFHVVDQVDLIAEAAVRKLQQLPATLPAEVVDGVVLEDCCRWFELEVTTVDTSQPRSEMEARVVHRGKRRSFQGFNRARHAVIEAAILATRLHLIPRAEIEAQYDLLQSAVEKTGGERESAAFEMLRAFVRESEGTPS